MKKFVVNEPTGYLGDDQGGHLVNGKRGVEVSFDNDEEEFEDEAVIAMNSQFIDDDGFEDEYEDDEALKVMTAPYQQSNHDAEK